MPDQLLGLEHVGRDHRRPGANPGPHRLAVGVEHDADVRARAARARCARRSPGRHRAEGCRPARRSSLRERGSRGGRGRCRPPAAVTSGPRSLISVCSPEVGSMTARLIRDSSAIGVRSWRIDSSASSSISRWPVGPPASPAAITGFPSRASVRATLIPLPPASGRLSTERWRLPWRKFGTAIVRSIAALRVTVMITDVLPDHRCAAARGSCACSRDCSASPPHSDGARSDGGARRDRSPVSRTRRPLSTRPRSSGWLRSLSNVLASGIEREASSAAAPAPARRRRPSPCRAACPFGPGP